jgi:type IV pilus assembly protein PilM
MEAIRGLLDNIVLEIQRSIDFYHVQFRGEQIRKVVLTGGGSLMPGLQPYIASYFDVEILMDNPLGHIHYDPRVFNGLTEMAPRFATAVGLALRPSLA